MDLDIVIDEQDGFLRQLEQLEDDITEQIRSNMEDGDNKRLIKTMLGSPKAVEAPKLQAIGSGVSAMLAQPKLNPQ